MHLPDSQTRARILGLCHPAERTFRRPTERIVRQIVLAIADCQRQQQVGESTHQYVTNLWCLASLYKLGLLEDEMIRDQLAEHTIDPKLREKLLTAPDDLSLSKAVDMAFQLESAAQLASRTAMPTPWSHIQLDICGELHNVPQHQRFLLVAYDLHSKWPEVLPTSSITTKVVIDFLSSLFALRRS